MGYYISNKGEENLLKRKSRVLQPQALVPAATVVTTTPAAAASSGCINAVHRDGPLVRRLALCSQLLLLES